MKLEQTQIRDLIRRAFAARKFAYTPYSHFNVGAALLTRNGKVYTGCNIENAAFTPTCCAERTAFFEAVAKGERHFAAIAVVGGRNGEITGLFPPCGVCRQVMMEFCEPDFLIHMGGAGDEIVTVPLGEFLPYGFTGEGQLDKNS